MKKSCIFFLVALLLITITISSCNSELTSSTITSASSKSAAISVVSDENSPNESDEVGAEVSDDISDITSEVTTDTSSTVSETNSTVSEPVVSQPVVIKYYNVTFDLNGGKIVSGQLKQQVENGKSPVAPTVKRDNYTFLGWDKTITVFDKDTTLKAKWQLAVVENPASDFEIIELVDSIIIKQYIGSSPNVVIPAKIKNKPVTQLGLMCFDGNVKSVILPEGLEVIGAHVFQKTEIETITLPSTLKKIGTAAFAECPNLKKINFPESLLEINHDIFYETPSMQNEKDEFFIKDGVLLKYNGTSSHVKVPSTVRLIANDAFRDTAHIIKEITLPSSVKAMNWSIVNIDKINFSEGLEYISSGGILDLKKLQTLKLPKSLKYVGQLLNEAYTLKNMDQEFVIFGDGVLRAYNGSDTTITIPNNVKVLSFFDFIRKDTVKVIIPESVKVLEALAVPNNEIRYGWEPIINLKEIYFPASITKLSDDFYYTSIIGLEMIKADKYVTFYVKKGSFMEDVFKFYNFAYKYY